MQPKQSCCDFCRYKIYNSKTRDFETACLDVNCECHSVKQSWEERFIKLNTEQEQSTRQILDFFSAELLRIKKEIVEQLTAEKHRIFTLSEEGKMDYAHWAGEEVGLELAKEIVERNLL